MKGQLLLQANKCLDFFYVQVDDDVPFLCDHTNGETHMKTFPFCVTKILSLFPPPTGLRELLGVPFASFAC